MAFEYLTAARDQGSTLLRLVHNGMLSDEYHGFAPNVDGGQLDKEWQHWLDRTFA